MKLPSFRKTKAQPFPPTDLHNADTVFVPVPETVLPVMPEYHCSGCGKPGATNNLIISYFGYITLPHVYICDTCEEARKEARKAHYVGLHRKPIAEKETLEIAALEKPARPRRTKLVQVKGPYMA